MRPFTEESLARYMEQALENQQRDFRIYLLSIHKNSHTRRRGANFTIEIVNLSKRMQDNNPKYRKQFDAVVRDLKDKFTRPRKLIEDMIEIALTDLDNCSFYPTEILSPYTRNPLSFFVYNGLGKYADQSSMKNGWIIQEDSAPGKFHSLERRLKREKDIKYEDTLDASASILFALHLILEGTRDMSPTCFPDAHNKKAMMEVVKALSSSVNKLTGELSESYLRGARLQKAAYKSVRRTDLSIRNNTPVREIQYKSAYL